MTASAPLMLPDFAPCGLAATHRLNRWSYVARKAAVYPRAYAAFVRREECRLIHAHFGTGAIEAAPIARRADVPLVVTFHGYDVLQAPYQADGSRYLARLQGVFAQAQLLLAVSDFLAEALLGLGAPPSKVRRHYLGVDTSIGTPASTGAAPWRTGIVFAGRLVPLKGADHLLAAVERLPAHLRGTPVTIIGDGPERSSLERRAAGMAGARVIFAGARSSAELAAAMASAAVVCGPSHAVAGVREAFGQVFLEAARASTPVVAYASGGVPEAVLDGSTGLLAPEGDVVGLADRLAALLDNPALAVEMGQRGRERVERSFAADAAMERLEDWYDDISAGVSPRS